MKIDLHCHTLKVKSGDKDTRNVDKHKFKEVMTSNFINFCAITNHNKFEKKQFLEFKEHCKEELSLWPGVELDVSVNGEKGHMLIISNPDNCDDFDLKIKTIVANSDVDSFCIDYDILLNQIKDMDVILIVHYLLLKKEGFSDKAIEIIKKSLSDKIPLLLEPSNLKSVGIMYANSLDGFIGSDVLDWDNYPSKKIPSLKMNVKDYRTFKLLLKKDKKVIDTFLDQKHKQIVSVTPFIDNGDFERIDLPIYNDVNIIFGGKGTGKSKILESIKNHFIENGESNQLSYYKASDNYESYKKMTEISFDEKMFSNLDIHDSKNDFDTIKQWKNASVNSTSLFYKGHKSLKAKSKISRFGFFKASYSYIENKEIYINVKKDYDNIINLGTNKNNIDLKSYLSKDEISSFDEIFYKLKNNAFDKLKGIWIENEAKKLVSKTINIMQEIGKIKSGEHAVPASTGISEFYSNLLKLYLPVKNILNSFNKSHKFSDEYLGHIPEKGDVYLRKEFYINPDEDISFSEISLKYGKSKMKKTDLCKFKSTLEKVKKNLFVKNCNAYLGELLSTYFSRASSLIDCFSFRCYTIIEKDNAEHKYDPSDGEKSMLQIHNSLISNEKKVFILDEPELSVGHNYINSVIVPRIKELAALDKIVIISTHDSNIAVRTLPINSIYREFKKTFIGNLFIDKLINASGEEYSWTEKSLEYLEGGETAFLERGDSYGI